MEALEVVVSTENYKKKKSLKLSTRVILNRMLGLSVGKYFILFKIYFLDQLWNCHLVEQPYLGGNLMQIISLLRINQNFLYFCRSLGMDQSLFALLDGEGGGTYELFLQYRMNRFVYTWFLSKTLLIIPPLNEWKLYWNHLVILSQLSWLPIDGFISNLKCDFI